MMRIKTIGLSCFILLNFKTIAQVGFGIRGSFQQSIPLVLRDSFSGKPDLGAGVYIYFKAQTKINFVAGLSYRALSVSHSINPYSLNWQTLAANIGSEWSNNKMSNTRFYTGANFNYIYAFGKTDLSANSASGQGYRALPFSQRVVPSIELGLIFNPNPFVTLNISTIQPIPQTGRLNIPTLPGMLSVGIEYRITTKDMKRWEKDTSVLPEQRFANDLKHGTLYVIEDGNNASQSILRAKMLKYYVYSKLKFIQANELSKTIELVKQSPDSNLCFFLKSGHIVYNAESPSTLGVIIYNYKMENPMPDAPFFVRDLSGNSNFDDPIILKKVVIKLNKRLNRL